MSTRFLYHVLSRAWESKVFDYTKKAHPSVIREEYFVPLLPIEIQAEIVRILDTFTDLTAELTAELTARKKQYEYYRNQLLSFEEGNRSPFLERLLDGVEVEWKALGEVVEFKRGAQLKPTDLIPGPYPVVTASKTENATHSEWNFGPDSITITSHGAYAGHVNYWSTPIWLANNVFLLRPRLIFISKFLFYFLKNYEFKIQGLAKGGGVPYFNTRDIAPLLIPIPCPNNPQKSLQIQADIVRILDKFDALTNSLTEGLPREIELRQKQYEYYHDLIFKSMTARSV